MPVLKNKYFIFFIIILVLLMFNTFSSAKDDTIRKLKFANSWYEGNCKLLNNELDKFIGDTMGCDTKPQSNNQSIKAIIAPHAGYVYSGKVAGLAYNSVKNLNPKRVFLLGPSHYIGFEGIILPQFNYFATPCGLLEIDQKTINNLKKCQYFSLSQTIQANEHSLELQLPFIFKLFPKAKLIPMVVGSISDSKMLDSVSKSLKNNITDGDLIIVSSDFTHYGPRYNFTPFSDNIPKNLKQLDLEAFNEISKINAQNFLNFQSHTQDTICGMYPIAILLSILPPNSKAQLIKYTTSSEVMKEESDNSVSYMAIDFYTGDKHINKTDNENIYTQSDKQYLRDLAKKTLNELVLKHKVLSLKPSEIPACMLEPRAVFVTLYSHDANHEKNLRGCIGNIIAQKPLYQAVIDNTILSATKDSRFLPVKADELANISIEINILTPPSQVASYKDIRLGTDGIILTKNNRSAVFLPTVATQYNWTIEETLTQLALKAGLKPQDWQNNCQFSVFQSVEF